MLFTARIIPNLLYWVNGRNPYLVLVIVALYDFYAAKCLDCLKIDILAFNSGCVIWIGLNTCSEVFYGNEFVRFVKKRSCERSQVKPLATGSSAKKPEVEVATIDIRNCFHRCQLKMLRSQTLRFGTPLRVGRTVRLDMNRLTGSVDIVPKIISWRNGVWRWNIPTFVKSCRALGKARAVFAEFRRFCGRACCASGCVYPVRSSNSICKSPRSSRGQFQPRHFPWRTKSHLRPSAIA